MGDLYFRKYWIKIGRFRGLAGLLGGVSMVAANPKITKKKTVKTGIGQRQRTWPVAA